MARGSWGAVIRQFDRLSRFGTAGGLDEGQLLDRFLARKDEAAFEAIVQRYGPMVLSVCRDLIPDPHDVDDAFQATFLVLVRRAGDLRRREQLGSWLHGVARRVAMRARAVSCRNKERIRTWDDEPEPASPAQARSVGEELRPLIREEVDRLPARYRDAVILCYFEGRTHEEAAERLGWPLGTVKGRLARARDQLRTRLERRGVDAAPLSVGLALSTGRAAVPALLQSRTVAAALAYLEVGPGPVVTTTIISGAVLELVQGALKSMTFGLTKLGLLGAIGVGTIAIPAVLSAQATRDSAATKPATSAASATAPSPKPDQPTANAPLESITRTQPTRPAGGEAGGFLSSPVTTAQSTSSTVTPELLLKEALEVYKAAQTYHSQGRLQTSELIRWSSKVIEAELATTKDKTGRIQAFEHQVTRAKELAEREASAFEAGRVTSFDMQSARFAATESAAWLQEAKQSPTGLPVSWANRSTTPLRDQAMLPAATATMPGMAGGGMGMTGGGTAGQGPGSGVAIASPPSSPSSDNPTILVQSTFPTATSPAGTPAGENRKVIMPQGTAVSAPGSPSGPAQEAAATKRARKPAPAGMPGMMGGMPGMMGGGGMPGGMGMAVPASDPESEKLSGVIRKQLDAVVSMNFPNETPLEDVLKYIKASTSKDKDDPSKGIPIYLDPIGLSEAEKTPTSTVTLDLEGVPLRTTLRLALDQLGLAYKVHDGVLIISTPERVDQLTQP